MKQRLRLRVKQRRAQMLLHSYLYYKRDEPLIDDYTWQKWADELVILQKEYKGQNKKTKVGFYDEMFEDWDGSTGCHLKFDFGIINAALRLLRYMEEYDGATPTPPPTMIRPKRKP